MKINGNNGDNMNTYGNDNNNFWRKEWKCLEKGEKGERFNQRNNVCMTKQGQLERMNCHQNLNWKQ